VTVEASTSVRFVTIIVGSANVGQAILLSWRSMTVEEAGTEYAPPRRLQQLPSWLASQVASHAARLVSEALAEEGVRRQHFTVLSALAEQGAASQAALGRRLWIDRSDPHAIWANWSATVSSPACATHGTAAAIWSSSPPAGAAALKRLEIRVEAAQDALLEPLSAADRQHLRRLLKRLVEHHARVPGQSTPVA
jgi:DNA-binding MarR family transcriptional regulator